LTTTAPADAGPKGQAEVLSKHESGGPAKRPKPSAILRILQPATPATGANGDGPVLSLVIMFAVLALFGAFALREALTNQRRA
jgi:hypothetical protein